MSSKTWLEQEPHAVYLTRQVDQVCDRFEVAWKLAIAAGGRPPRMEEYLFGTPEPQFSALRRELEELATAYRPLHRSSRSGRPASDGAGGGKTAAPYSTDAPVPSAGFDQASTLDLAAAQIAPASDPAVAGRTNGSAIAPEKHVRCLHCHHPLDLTKNDREEVLCPACGSSFRICDPSGAGLSAVGVPTLVGSTPAPAEAGTPTHRARRLAPSRSLGKFQLIERVGAGAYGEVWRAEDTELHRTVALKIPLPIFASEPSLLERFYREARAAAQLRHPGIVSVHEVIMLDGMPVIVSDFIHGVSLRRLLAERGLTFEEAAELTAQVADALDYAHSMGLVHRDIKPGNIMMSSLVLSPSSVAEDKQASDSGRGLRTTDYGHPLIMDFGLALREDAEITLTLDGHVVGTPAYMSPEQAVGQGHRADRRSDVYSLGVILYEMLAGELPFRGSKQYILQQVDREEPRPPRKINDKIPRDLETIVLKAMSKAPSRRYATAREMADDLRRFLRGEPILARPVGRTEKLLRWSRRNPGLATAAAVIVVTTMGVFVSGAVAIERTRSASKTEDQRSLAEKNHREAHRLSTQMMLHRGRTLAEDGEVAEGMLRLAHALEADRGANPDLERVLRANLAAFLPLLIPLKEVFPGSSPVLAVAFSPDGKLFATGGKDGQIQLFETATSNLMWKVPGHDGPVIALTFSRDSRHLLTGSQDKTARVWEVVTGKNLGRPLEHQESVLSVAFSPDGSALLTGSFDATVRAWDIKTREMIPSLTTKDPSAKIVAFSKDARKVLVDHRDSFQVWDIASQKAVGIPMKHILGAAMAFAMDEKADTLVMAPRDGEIGVWDAKSGKRIAPTFPRQSGLLALALSADGKMLVTGYEDKTARLWSMEDGTPIGHALMHPAAVHAIALSPDGRDILTGSADKAARIWQKPSGDSPCTMLAHQEKVRAGAYSPDGKRIVTASYDKTGQIWDVPTGKPIGLPLQHQRWILSAAFSPDGKTVLTGSADKTACLWDAQTGQELFTFPHQGYVYSVAFSPDGKLAATSGSSNDNCAHLWDLTTGLALFPGFAHRGAVLAVAFSPDGSQVLTASEDGTAGIWDVATGQRQQSLNGHQDMVKVVRFSPDGKKALTSSFDHTACLWDPLTGQQIGQPFIHNDEVWAAAFSPDGRLILTGSHDNTAHLWDAHTGEAVGPALQHHSQIASVAFSPDSRTVLTGSNDKTARLWDVTTGEPLGPPLLHASGVKAVAFNPTGKDFWTGSDDFYGRIWPAPLPVEGKLERVLLWTQLVTGMELEAGGGLRPLEGSVWEHRRQSLQELGGPPKF